MEIIKKKNGILRKVSWNIAAALCLMFVMITAAGCGKVEEPVPVHLSSGNVEELQNGSIGENEDDPEAAPGDSDSAPEDISGGESKVETGDDTDENVKNDTESDTTGKTVQNDSSDENDQQTKDVQSQSAGSAELVGDVRSIGADFFVVARVEVWSEGDADYAVVATSGYEDEEDLITVHMSQNCVWEFKTVKNGGINPEDVSAREGSFADLQEGISTTSKGSWQDDGSFLADSIVMMLFV
ncbi:MAG: hypothetical protein K2O59_17095 [Lachnospiraceae bacterium]|nr:hypothetical protein [Lachnospiraceae bacterium]